MKHVDILVHVSVSDLQRNADLYSLAVQRQFDEFAPGWRMHVSLDANLQSVRAVINGGNKRIRVCTRCLRSKKVIKAA